MSKKPAKKKAASKKPPKGMSPIPKSRLDAENNRRSKAGKPPIDANGNELALAPKPEKIKPSDMPVNDIFAAKIKHKDGGMIEIKEDLTDAEGVSMICFYADSQRSAGFAIGIILNNLQKRTPAILESIALSTGLEIKTLRNYSTTMKGVTSKMIQDAQKRAEKSGHEITFTQVREVAALPAAKQAEILNKAADEGISSTEVKALAAAADPESKKRKAAKAKKTKAETSTETASTGTESTATGSEEQQGEIELPMKLSPDLATRNAEMQDMADKVDEYLNGEDFKLLSNPLKKEWYPFLLPLKTHCENLCEDMKSM